MTLFKRRLWFSTRWKYGWVFLSVALFSLTAGCASDNRADERPPLWGLTPLVAPPGQTAVQICIIGTHETVRDGKELPFPSPGFVFKNGVLIPIDKPGSVAGIEMTQEQFLAWANNLECSGNATLYLAPIFNIPPNYPVRTANRQSVDYTSNWDMSNSGQLSLRRDSFKYGTVAEILRREIVNSNQCLLSVSMDIVTGELQQRIAVEYESNKLKVELPYRHIQHVTTTTPIMDNHSVVLLHYVKQHRTLNRESGIPENIRDQLFYVASYRSGLSPESTIPGAIEHPGTSLELNEENNLSPRLKLLLDPDGTIKPLPEVPARRALTLLWAKWEGMEDAPFPDASETSAHPTNSPMEQLQNSPTSGLLTLGVAISADEQAKVDIGEECDWVAGKESAKQPDGEESTQLKIIKSKAGLVLDASLKKNGVEGLDVQGRLGDIIRLRDSILHVPDPHRPKQGRVNTYHVSNCIQSVATIQTEIAPITLDQLYKIDATWEGIPLDSEEKHAILLRLQGAEAAPPSGPDSETITQTP